MAAIAGFAVSPLAASFSCEIDIARAHLRKLLGDDGYESLAHAGRT
jgi:hypothetical protein